MSAVEMFIDEQNQVEQSILRALHFSIMQLPGIESKIRYNIPFYYRKSWICYLNPIKTGGVELCVLRANELPSLAGDLQFRDRKQVAGLHIEDPEAINYEQIAFILQEAYQLDQEIPYASKRKATR